jgi:hypothetical protein
MASLSGFSERTRFAPESGGSVQAAGYAGGAQLDYHPTDGSAARVARGKLCGEKNVCPDRSTPTGKGEARQYIPCQYDMRTIAGRLFSSSPGFGGGQGRNMFPEPPGRAVRASVFTSIAKTEVSRFQGGIPLGIGAQVLQMPAHGSQYTVGAGTAGGGGGSGGMGRRGGSYTAMVWGSGRASSQ